MFFKKRSKCLIESENGAFAVDLKKIIAMNYIGQELELIVIGQTRVTTVMDKENFEKLYTLWKRS